MERTHKNIGGISTNSMYDISSLSNCHFFDGSEAVMPGACWNQLTSAFPKYPPQRKVMEDIISTYQKSGGDKSNLPNIPASVVGNTDFMINGLYFMV